MTRERREPFIEKHVKCLKCYGIARHIKTDYFYTKKSGIKVEWTKMYRCNKCGTEWLKEINSILG